MVLPPMGLTRLCKGSLQGEEPLLGNVRIRPTLVIRPPTAAPPTRTPPEDTPQTHAHPAVQRPERRSTTVLEVPKPATQRPADVRDYTRQTLAVRSPRLGTEGVLELPQTLRPRPTCQAAPPRVLEVIAQKVKAFLPYVHDTDQPFTSGCSPARLAATQLPSATRSRPNLGRDFHPADSTRLQAHTPAALPGR